MPEWYFWPFYAILRSFTADFILPAKLWGVLAMFSSILLLFFLPWIDQSPVRSGSYRPVFKRFFWLLVIDVIVLGWAAAARRSADRDVISQIAAAYYFLHFLVILPLVSAFETPLPLPRSISDSVLHGEEAEAAPLRRRAGTKTPRRPPSKGDRRQMRSCLGFIGAVFAGGPAISLISGVCDLCPEPAGAAGGPKSSTAAPSTLHLAATARFGKFDRQQLQRGFQVYSEVCSACHSLKLVSFRDLKDLGYRRRRDQEDRVATGRTQVPVDQSRHRRGSDRKALPSDTFPDRRSRTRPPRAPPTTMRFRPIFRSSPRRARAALLTSIRILTGIPSDQPAETSEEIPGCQDADRTFTTIPISRTSTSRCRRRSPLMDRLSIRMAPNRPSIRWHGRRGLPGLDREPNLEARHCGRRCGRDLPAVCDDPRLFRLSPALGGTPPRSGENRAT